MGYNDQNKQSYIHRVRAMKHLWTTDILSKTIHFGNRHCKHCFRNTNFRKSGTRGLNLSQIESVEPFLPFHMSDSCILNEKLSTALFRYSLNISTSRLQVHIPSTYASKIHKYIIHRLCIHLCSMGDKGPYTDRQSHTISAHW